MEKELKEEFNRKGRDENSAIHVISDYDDNMLRKLKVNESIKRQEKNYLTKKISVYPVSLILPKILSRNLQENKKGVYMENYKQERKYHGNHACWKSSYKDEHTYGNFYACSINLQCSRFDICCKNFGRSPYGSIPSLPSTKHHACLRYRNFSRSKCPLE